MAAGQEPSTLRRIVGGMRTIVGGKGGVILCVVCGLLGALCIGIGIVNLRAATQSASWPSTGGEIVHAEVEEHVTVSRDKDRQSTRTSITYEANVAYVYRVGGQEYRGQRVRFDWDADRAQAEAIVAKYPQGASVSVYYDPDDPADAVLEPGGEASVYIGLIQLGVLFLAIAGAYLGIRALMLRYLPGFRLKVDHGAAGRVEDAQGWRAKWAACNWMQKAAVVVFFPILGAAFLGWMGLSFAIFYAGVEGYLRPNGSQRWLETSGLVVTSEMKRILVIKSDDSGGGGTYHRNDLNIVIEYRVLANRYSLQENPSITGDEEGASEVLGRYAKGSYVSVYYNPSDPGEAQLNPREPEGVASIVIGALMMAPWLLTGLAFGLIGLKRRYLSPSRPAGAA